VVVTTFPPPVESELDVLKKAGAGRVIFVPNEVRSFDFWFEGRYQGWDTWEYTENFP